MSGGNQSLQTSKVSVAEPVFSEQLYENVYFLSSVSGHALL
jgi:hypothetical protein